MTDKNNYFVAVKTKEVREMPIDDDQVEFEIIATEDEVKEILELFHKMDNNSKETMQYIIKDPFDEWSADDERDEYEKNLELVYKRLFEFGTFDTKDKIKKLGIIK